MSPSGKKTITVKEVIIKSIDLNYEHQQPETLRPECPPKTNRTGGGTSRIYIDHRQPYPA